jgi:hypothetical protein
MADELTVLPGVEDLLALGEVRREQSLQVRRERLGQAEQPQRLRGGTAVDDHDLPQPALREAAHLTQGEQVLHAGQHGELVGHQLVDARAGQQRAEVVLEPGPRAVQQRPGVDVRGEEAGVEFCGLSPEVGLERIAERVRWVGGDRQHLAAGAREDGCGGRGEGGLADASLTGEQDDAHDAEG